MTVIICACKYANEHSSKKAKYFVHNIPTKPPHNMLIPIKVSLCMSTKLPLTFY